MVTKSVTVPIVAELQMELKSLQNIEKAITETFNKAGPGTALAKNLSDSLAKIRPLLKEYEQLQIKPEIDATGIRRMDSIFNSIVNEYTKRASQIEFMSPENMLPESALTRIKQMRAELAGLRADLVAIERNGASGRTEDLLKASPQHADLHNRAKSASTKYSGEDTIAANARALEQEAATAQNKVSDLEAAGEKLAQALKAAQANLDSARQALQSAEKDAQAAKVAKERSNKVRNEFTFLQMLEGLRGRETKSGKIDIEGWHDTKESRAAYTNEEGNLSANVSLALRKYLEDLKFDDKTITDILGASFKQIPDLIAKAFADAAKAGETTLEEQFAKASKVAGDLRGTVVPKNVGNVEIWADTTNKNYQAAQKKLEQAKGNLQKYEQEYGDADVAVYENQEALQAAQASADALSTVSKALSEVARTAKEAAAALKREDIEKKEADIENASNGAKGDLTRTMGQGGDPEPMRDNHRTGIGAMGENFKEKSDAEREAEQFTANLKQSIKQWMSAQQVINLIKDGVRQAYNDIKNLDSAMTNIAVVTDMSVGDLWGKINEYMAIAQEYGVSTQGVYEVSQLYYQQGLGTADVMAATTETLKMARIAGMDYADAADAMTVAIRSFKMEITDAAHVTDVYSKVAAVTASDSEELAIAMSKTASSAESVGSSFENTTAMLAVMIETTRESAQNLGSALKSIISRYGEMKVGATVDAEGEALDYNKVDTALKSVGISIKDAQGQFRDFDEVIFELSEKWDSLDSVTQRYIATIMAGNRQQSRFIALVDNWERLDEVAGAAQNSEDAGLLQYVKTLDSLETKLSNIKTSFQEFYMSIFNGPLIKGALDVVNNIIKGFNKLGNWQAILNIAGFIRSVKSIAKMLVSVISPSFSSIVTDYKSAMSEMVNAARQAGYDSAKAFQEGQNAAQNGAPLPAGGTGITETQKQSWFQRGMIGDKSGNVTWSSWNGNKWGSVIQTGGQLIGAGLSAYGAVKASEDQRAGAVISGLGNVAQGVSMGAALGPWGAVIGGVIGGLASLPAVLEAFDPASVLKEKLEKAEEALSEANVKRAETKDTYNRLDTYITKLRQLESTRFDSTESYEEWVALNAEVLETFPELASSFDEANNAIVVLNSAEKSLTQARLAAADAAKEAADKQIAAALAKDESDEYALRNAEAKKIISTTNPNFQYQTSGMFAPEDFEGLYEAIPAGALYQGNYAEATRQAKSANRRAFVYEDQSGLISYEFATAELARAFDYIDFTNQNAVKWYLELAEITDPERFYEQLSAFDSSYLMDGFETAEEDFILSLFQSDAKEYANVTTVAQLVKAAQGELFTKERNAFQSEQAVTNAIQSGVATYVSSQFLGRNTEESYVGLAGVSSIFQDYLVDKFQAYSEEQLKKNPDLDISKLWENWTINGFGQEFTDLDEYYEKFYSQLKISGKIEDYNAFVANADSYNRAEYNKILRTEFGLDRNSELYQILTEQFEEEYNSARETFIESLKNVNFINKRDTDKVDEAGEAIYELEKEPVNIPKEYMDEITAFARKLQGYVDDDMMSDTSADSLWNQYLAIWNTIDSTGTETQQAILRRLFGSADLTTPEGVAALEQAIQAETGLEGLGSDTINGLIEQAKGLIPNSLVNLNASYNSLMSNVATNIDAQASALSKAGDGFSNLTDLQEFTDKSGLDLSDFVFDDGKWYLDYTEETAEKIRESVQQNYKTQKDLIEKSNQEQVDLVTKANLAYKPGDTTTAETLLKEERFAGEGQEGIRAVINQHWDNYVAWVKEDTANTGKTFAEYLSTYYANQLADLDAQSAEYIEWAQAELEKADKESKRQRKINKRTDLLSGSFEYQNIIEAWNSIVSQGISGYSAEDIATLEHDLGISGLGVRKADGSYDLAIAKIQGAPQWVRNALLANIQSEIESAKSAIEGLGGDIFDATESDYSEAFSYLAEAGFQGKEIKKSINYALMQSVVGDPGQLEEYIGRELAHKMGRDYNKEFATEFGQEITDSRENMVAAFKDNYIEQIKSYNDLVYKKIVGTATFEELEQLDDLAVDLNIDLGQFTGRLIDDLSTYAQSIIDNAYLSAEEKNKYLKEAAILALDARAMAQAYNLDETSLTAQSVNNLKNYAEANKTIVSSKNRLTSTQAGELIAAYSISTGLDFNTLAGLFDYNDSDSTFSLPEAVTTHDLQYKALEILAKTDEDVAAILAKYKQDYTKIVKALDEENITEGLNIVGSTEAFEEIIKSTQQAQYLGRETRVEKYVSTVEKFASGQNVTFDELISLYTDLGQTFDINQLYKDWLSGPEKLIENIEQIVGTDSLTSDQQAQIQAAKERGIQTLIESIVATTDKALNNTATLDDLLALAKTTGIDLTGMVSKTSSGYGLNQQGMLMVAAARAQMTGDFSSEAAKLVDSYAGKGGIFGNAKALEAMLTSMGDAISKTQELIIKAGEQEAVIYKKEKERLEKQKELQEAQVQILQQAQKAFAVSEAKSAANFMGVDPFGGALEDYDNYVNSHKTAQEVLKAAYGNGGVIADYKQAGQLLNFIGYGQGWTQTDANKNLNTLLKYTTSEGTDFADAYREIFKDQLAEGLSDSEVLLEAAKLMDQAAEKMQKELDARIEANEAFAEWHKQTVDDITKRVELSKEEVQKQFLDTETKDGETVPVLKDTELMSHITGKYMTTLNGKQVGITDATIQDIAQTRYGDDWKTALADAGNLTSFLKDIDTLFTNFKYDQSSDLSYDEQFASYAKGEAAAQEVEKRLNKLQEDLQGLVTTPESMAGLNEGLDESIEKAKELNRLLVEAKIGTVYTTGTDTEDENLDTGIIVGSIDKLENYKEQLAKLYNIEKEAIEFNEEQNLISYNPQEGRGFSYSIKQQPETSEPDVPGVKNPLIGTVQYTGQFNEIDTWIAENSHIQAVYTLTTPEDAKAALQKKLLEAREAVEALSAEANDFDLTQEENADLANSLDNAKAKVKELEAELADLETRYPTPDDGTVQLKVTGTAPESDAELIKWKEDLAKALEGAGNVELTIIDDKGNIITDINSITKGQQITISAGLADGTSFDTIKTLVKDVNDITDGLKGAAVQIEVTGLTTDTVTTVTDLKSALEGLKNSPAASGVTINIGGDAAQKAAQIIKDINAAKNNGQPNEASLNFTVSYTVNGKAVDFDEKGLPVLPKADEDTANENANDGDKEDPGSITLTIKGVDPTSAEAAKKAISDLGKDVQITFKQGDKEFTDVNDLVPETPVEIQIQYKMDDEAGKSTSEEIVNAIGEIAGKKSVNITVTGLDDTTAKKVTQLAADLAGLNNPPETINIEVRDKDGNSLTLANDFATKLGAIKSNYESTVTITVKYVDENGNSIALNGLTTPFNTATGDTTQNTQNDQLLTPSFNEVLDELSNLADQTKTTAQQEADYYKQRIQQMEQEKTEVERKMESSPTLLSEYYHQYAEKYLRGDSEWSQQRQSYAHAKSTATDTVDETEEVIEEIQAIKEEAASIALITDDTEAQAALDNLNAKISQLVSSHPTLFINVKVKSFTLEDIILPTGEKAPSTDGTGQYTGNVNGIAYADGNVDSLIAGAHLAHKTLVGELGPELGVWDGMYHLLGQNGAEFANVPDDAIVFNHRQTEGILKGQSGVRGRALASGTNQHTITPPWATAGGYVEFLNSLGRGNGSTTYKFTDVGDLEKWYNLLRKIAKLEKEITLEQAKRENMLDGHDWLKSYREEQSYLHEQIAVQKLLIDYQKEQLALERERIEQDEWWSHSLTFNEDGTLLSVFGNEVGGGEGAFAYLDMLNNLSGNEQIAALKKLGYSYVGKDGKALEGEELVKQFISEYQEIVGSYNELDDSILDAEAKVEELTSAINDLEEEIKNNQKELEKTIYDLLVEAAEREIEQMEEQHELLKEANQKYIDGLSEALNKEQQLYEKNKSIEEREALQRQLSLLRRSGGSASEIEALEQQLDDTLKNEYFDKQQQMIEDVSKASELQAELMEQQVKLQEEALEYQKENGVIWTKVYEVMSGSYEEILAFLTGQDIEFFEASALVQETMLLDWAKMIGIYDEDRGSKAMTAEAQSHWEDGTVLNNLTEEQQGHYAQLSDQDKTAAQKHYNSVYTSSRLDGMTDEEARKAARDSMVERLRVDEETGITHWDPRGEAAQKPGGYSDGKRVYYGGYKPDGTFVGGDKCYAENENVAANYAKGKGIDITSRNTYRTGSSPIGPWKKWYIESPTNGRLSSQGYDTKIEAERQINFKKNDLAIKQKKGLPIAIEDTFWKDAVAKLYKTGGLVDYTGLAMVHGSKSKPESFLNSDQTAQITAALRETTGKESVLGSLQSTMNKLKSVIHNLSTINNSNTQSISIAPGAVVIQVEQLADSYDIEEVSRDVMNRMVAIANKATNRGVNRR